MLVIDGVQMPNPTKYRVSMSDLDSSDTGRTESGILTRDRIRQGVTKIEVGFIVRGSEAAAILEAVEPAMVPVQYYDPRADLIRNIQAYVGDRQCVLKVCLPDMSASEFLWEISFNLTEY